MNENSEPLPIPPSRILVACSTEADTCRVLEALEKLENLDIQKVADEQAFQKSLNDSRPDLVIASYDFGALQFLKSVREARPEIPFVLILESEASAGILRKGINIYIAKQELSGLCAWVEALAILRCRNLGKDIELEGAEKIRAAVTPAGERIPAPALDEMRVEARRFSKPPKERAEALRTWTREIEKKKIESAPPPQKTGHEDPLIPFAISAAEKPASPSPEPILTELRKLQADLASQLENLNAQIKEIQAKKKRGVTKSGGRKKRKTAGNPTVEAARITQISTVPPPENGFPKM